MHLSPEWYNVFLFSLAVEYLTDFVKAFLPFKMHSRFDKCFSFLATLLLTVLCRFTLLIPASFGSYLITSFVIARLSHILHDYLSS